MMATQSIDARIKAAKDKLAELTAAKQKKAALERSTAASQKRKDDNRKKYIIGGFIMGLMEKNGISVSMMSYESIQFIGTLKNDSERKLFGLPPLEKK
jgi:hypothetical protein